MKSKVRSTALTASMNCWNSDDLVVGDLHGLAELDAAMHRDFEIEAGAARPGAPVVDVTGETLLAAIEIDGGDALAGLHQGDGNMQGGGGFTRTALLVAQHNDVRRAGLSLTSLHQHVSTPAISSNYARPRSSEMRK